MQAKDFFGDAWSMIQANWVSILIWTAVALGLIGAIWWYRTYMMKNRVVKLPALPLWNKSLKPVWDKHLVVFASPAHAAVARSPEGGLYYHPQLQYLANFAKNPHLAPVAAFHKDVRFGKDSPVYLTFDKQFVLSPQNKAIVLKPIRLMSKSDSFVPNFDFKAPNVKLM